MAVTKWNPNNPSVAGSEWFGVNGRLLTPNASLAQGGTITATASESVTAIDTVILNGGGQPTQPLMQCDVYDLANPVFDPQTLVLAKPVSNYYNGPGWQQFASSAYSPMSSTAYTRVNKIVSLADANSIANNGTQLSFFGPDPVATNAVLFDAGNAGFWDGTTGASGATLSGKRVAWVEVCTIVDNQTNDFITVDGYLQNFGPTAPYTSDSGPKTILPFSGPWRVQHAFYVNRVSGGLPWNQSDASSLTSGGWGFGTGVVHMPGAGQFNVYAIMLQFHVLPERRVAVGFGFGSQTTDIWSSFGLASPATYSGAAWSKTSGHQYAILFSPVRANAILTGMDSATTAGHATDLLTNANLCGVGLGPGLVPSAALVESPGQACAVMIVGGAASIDSTPYAAGEVVTVGANGAASTTQRISTGSAQTYGTMTVVCATTSDGKGGTLQNSTLDVSLKRTSDNAVLLGPVSIQTSQVPADGLYHVVTLQVPGGTTLTNAEQVYLYCASTSTVGWSLPCMLTRAGVISPSDTTAILAETAGIGGSADYGNGDGTIDFPWSIGIVPATPGSFAATVANDPQDFIPPGGPANVSYTALTWTTTSLGSAFGYYELQRQDGGVWYDITIITEEKSNYFNDTEVLRNVAQSYRLRVIRLDGGTSAWTSTVTITVPTPYGCDLVLATNWQPQLSLAFQESGDQSGGGIGGNPNAIHSYARANAASTVVHLIAGSKTPIAFRPLIEGNSDIFSRTVLLGAAGSPGSTAMTNTMLDRVRFDALLALIENTSIPYITLCDGHGRRWNCFVEFVDGSYAWQGTEHEADLKFTEVASVPSVLTTGTPPTP